MDVGRFLVEEIVMVSQRQNCKRHDRKKDLVKTIKVLSTKTGEQSLIKCLRRCL